MNARKLAVQLLDRTEQEQSYSNLLLDGALSGSDMDERKSAFVPCSIMA